MDTQTRQCFTALSAPPMYGQICSNPRLFATIMPVSTLNIHPSQIIDLHLLVVLATYPGHAWLPPNTYPITDLEHVLVRDTLKLMLLVNILKLLSNCIKDQTLLTLDGTFSTLRNWLESNQFFSTQQLQDIPIEFSDCIHAHLILIVKRLHVLDLEVRPQKINHTVAHPSSSFLEYGHFEWLCCLKKGISLLRWWVLCQSLEMIEYSTHTFPAITHHSTTLRPKLHT